MLLSREKRYEEVGFMSIKVNNLSKSYIVGDVKKIVLKDISFEIFEGEFISIMGPSGSGKSTLIKCISTLEDFDSGSVVYGDREISRLGEKDKSDFRANELGFVFQEYNLLDILTVKENISMPLILNGFCEKNLSQQVEKWLNTLDIKEISGKYPSEISGGENQRTAIARAFIKNPKYIFADEPTGSLDSTNSKKVMEILSQLNKKRITIIMVTHDPLAASYADRVLFLRDGLIYNELTKDNRNSNFYTDILKELEALSGR